MAKKNDDPAPASIPDPSEDPAAGRDDVPDPDDPPTPDVAVPTELEAIPDTGQPPAPLTDDDDNPDVPDHEPEFGNSFTPDAEHPVPDPGLDEHGNPIDPVEGSAERSVMGGHAPEPPPFDPSTQVTAETQAKAQAEYEAKVAELVPSAATGNTAGEVVPPEQGGPVVMDNTEQALPVELRTPVEGDPLVDDDGQVVVETGPNAYPTQGTIPADDQDADTAPSISAPTPGEPVSNPHTPDDQGAPSPDAE